MVFNIVQTASHFRPRKFYFFTTVVHPFLQALRYECVSRPTICSMFGKKEGIEVVQWKISRQKGALLVLLLRSSSSTSDALAERHLATLASRLPFSRAWASRLSWLAKLTKDEKCSELGKLWEIVYSNAILHVQFNLILGGLWQWRLLQGLSIVLWAVPNDLVHTHWRITWPFAYANYDNAAKYDLNEAAATWARSF